MPQPEHPPTYIDKVVEARPAHEIASRVKQHQGVVSECDGNMNEKLLQDSAAATQTTRNPQWQWLAGAGVRWN